MPASRSHYLKEPVGESFLMGKTLCALNNFTMGNCDSLYFLKLSEAPQTWLFLLDKCKQAGKACGSLRKALPRWAHLSLEANGDLWESKLYFLNFFFGWKAGSLLQGDWLEGLLQAVDKDAGAGCSVWGLWDLGWWDSDQGSQSVQLDPVATAAFEVCKGEVGARAVGLPWDFRAQRRLLPPRSLWLTILTATAQASGKDLTLAGSLPFSSSSSRNHVEQCL